MEILFPDVVGSGGAPKRIMKPRRRNPDGSMPPRLSDVDSSVLDPTLDSSASTAAYNSTSSQTPLQRVQPPTQQLPAPSTTQSLQRATSTTIPPRAPAASATNALTPPDETTPNTESRKRLHSDITPGNSERRRGRPSRFAPSFYNHHTASGVASTSSVNLTHHTPPPPPAASTSILAPVSAELIENGILSLAEALKARAAPKWPEQAVEILFREFAEEDPDLQLKIAEKALTDDNKAMVFVKMTPVLRRHWVSRLREVHMRNLGGGLGLGRVGEEAS